MMSTKIRVLDNGFVQLVDKMGDDSSVVKSARVCYAGGTKTVREDAQLIDYLMRNQHMSPFEMVVFVVHIKHPLFIAAQFVRHRTARLNAVSARYSEMTDDFYYPGPENMRVQSTTNKQGSERGMDPEDAKMANQRIIDMSLKCYGVYQELLANGVAREQARMVLPQNLYTEWIWQMDLRNLLHFLELRLDSHAQAEIQEYARAILALIEPIVPVTIETWKRHRLKAGT